MLPAFLIWCFAAYWVSYEPKGVKCRLTVRLQTERLNSRCQKEKYFVDGGAKEGRTPDLLNAIQTLYQLSYDPVHKGKKRIVNFPEKSNISLQEFY